MKGILPLERIFGLCKTLRKITQNRGYHLTFKTADLQDKVYTILATDVKVTSDKFHLYVAIFFPSAESQR